MQYLYTVMWLAVGLLLIFRYGRKEGKIFYAAGGFFLILAAWWGTAAVTGMDLFHGTWGWVLRIICAVFLIVLVPPFLKRYQQERSDAKQSSAAEMEDRKTQKDNQTTRKQN